MNEVKLPRWQRKWGCTEIQAGCGGWKAEKETIRSERWLTEEDLEGDRERRKALEAGKRKK